MSSTIFQVSTFSVDELPVTVLLPISNAITAKTIQVSGDRKTDFIFMFSKPTPLKIAYSIESLRYYPMALTAKPSDHYVSFVRC